MLSIQEINTVLEKGMQKLAATKNPSLSLEVSSLKEELKSLSTAKGSMAEATLLSCEYYCNEINNSLTIS